jgi:hypothetical protein
MQIIKFEERKGIKKRGGVVERKSEKLTRLTRWAVLRVKKQ